MTDAPIPLVLDLWALGHGAVDIARKLGLPGHKEVTDIVRKARSIRDPRAVQHEMGGKPLGKGCRRMAGVEIVPKLLKTLCPAGHARTPDNLTPSGYCRTCRQIRNKLNWQAEKAARS